MLAIDLLGKSIPVLHTSDSVQKALERMIELKVNHLPIVDDTRLMGLVSETDLQEAVDPETPVGSLTLSMLLGFIYDYQPVYDVFHLMNESRLTLLPVVDQTNTYLGCIGAPEIFAKLDVMTSASQPGGIIVLEMNERDVTLQEILRIIESNNAHLLSLFTESIPNTPQLLVTLKLNQTDLDAILATFERFNYQIKFSYQNKGFREDTQERFEAFMNYLKL